MRGGGDDHGRDVVMEVDVPGAVVAASATTAAAAAAVPAAARKGGGQEEGIGLAEEERERDVGLLLERMREKREDVEKNAEMRVGDHLGP